MKLPFTFKEFVTKPFAAIAIICISGMGYLYIDAQNSKAEVIEACQKDIEEKDKRIEKLETDVKDLYEKIIEMADAKD